MKGKRYLKIIFLLLLVSLFLPWFTYDAKMMGYCWGYQFLKWLAVPLIIIAGYLFVPIRNKIYLILTEVSMIANLSILVIVFGRWQEACNIVTGFQWKDGWYTALPTYWMSAALFVTFFVVFQYDLLKKRSE